MKKNGFTMIELLALVFIIGILTSIGFINYQEIRGRLALNRAAHQLLQDLRKAQETAMSTIDIKGSDCTFSRAPLHFASLSHLALGDPFDVFCNWELIGSSQVKFTADPIDEPIGHFSYFWTGFASGCSDDHICIKDFVEPYICYDSGVAVTDNYTGQTVSAVCDSCGPPPVLDDDWQLIIDGEIQNIYNYGVYINTNEFAGSNTSYKLYVDIDGLNATSGELGYNSPADCIVSNINIAEKGVIIKEIKNLTVGRDNTSIGFASPNPDIIIAGLDPAYDSVKIVLALASDPNNPDKQRTIVVNKAGLLEME